MNDFLKTVEQRLLWLSHWTIHNANHLRGGDEVSTLNAQGRNTGDLALYRDGNGKVQVSTIYRADGTPFDYYDIQGRPVSGPNGSPRPSSGKPMPTKACSMPPMSYMTPLGMPVVPPV